MVLGLGGMGFLNPRGGSLKGTSLRGREARDWECRSWGSDHSADENLSNTCPPSPAACSRLWAEGVGFWSQDAGLSRCALVFIQLEPYMDENFISRAFATMGETVMSVKIIRNRLTGYVLSFHLLSSPLITLQVSFR